MSNNHGRRYLLSKIQDGRQPTKRKYLYLRNYDIYHQHSNDEPTAFDHGNSQEVYLDDSNDDRQSETVA